MYRIVPILDNGINNKEMDMGNKYLMIILYMKDIGLMIKHILVVD